MTRAGAEPAFANDFTQHPIEEEIEQATMNDTTNGAAEMHAAAETFTSEFYQAPCQGGIPVRLTVESRRPFTPPFAQLCIVNSRHSKRSSDGKSGAGVDSGCSAGKVPTSMAATGEGEKTDDSTKKESADGRLTSHEEPIEEEILA